jgi:sulfate adenylyltransferase subunit 1
LPSGLTSRIKSIEIGGNELQEVFAPQSVVLQLEDDIDISRGDVIVKNENKPHIGQELKVLLCWMDNKPLAAGSKYLLQINSRTVKSVVKEIEYKLDVNTLEKNYSAQQAGLNDIVKVTIKTASPLSYDSYKELQVNGGAILIDETSNVTVGACMIQ